MCANWKTDTSKKTNRPKCSGTVSFLTTVLYTKIPEKFFPYHKVQSTGSAPCSVNHLFALLKGLLPRNAGANFESFRAENGEG